MSPPPEVFTSTISSVCYYECLKVITRPESWLHKPEFMTCTQQDKSGLHSQYIFLWSNLLLKKDGVGTLCISFTA